MLLNLSFKSNRKLSMSEKLIADMIGVQISKLSERLNGIGVASSCVLKSLCLGSISDDEEAIHVLFKRMMEIGGRAIN